MTDESIQPDSLPLPVDTEESGLSFSTFAIIAVSVIVVLYALVFIGGLVAAVIFDEGAMNWFAYLSDLITIALSLTTVLTFVGMGIVVIQVARLVNLVRSEVKPISEDAKQALHNVRTTTEFVQKHGVEPVIKAQTFMAGIMAFLAEFLKLTRILRRQKEDK